MVNILKRNYFSLSIMWNLSPHFKAVSLSLLTFTLLLANLTEGSQGVQLACVGHLDSIHSSNSLRSMQRGSELGITQSGVNLCKIIR